MATDKFPELRELTLKSNNKGIISFIANGVIPMWSVVVIVPPPSVGDLPLIEVSTFANEVSIIGIAVGGSGTPVNSDGSTGNAADNAGDIVDVAVLHSAVITKAITDGTSISIGDNLVSDPNGFVSESSIFSPPIHVIGKAMQPSTMADDTILIFMGGSS